MDQNLFYHDNESPDDSNLDIIRPDDSTPDVSKEEETEQTAELERLEELDEQDTQLEGGDRQRDEQGDNSEGAGVLTMAAAERVSDPDVASAPENVLSAVVGVRFRTAGKVYYFSPGELKVHRGTHVVVETSRGKEYGTVVSSPFMLDSSRFKAPLRTIDRIASTRDSDIHEENVEHEEEAKRICQSRIRAHHLDMKLIDAEYTFDGSKILFYFTAEGRVDFRDLVRDLAGIFHTRIELRQVGVRDETRILGGYGVCGRPLCCHTYLTDFVPVSIRMAKEQNLSLNPAKISGVCGRLMCCLKNEEETYEELNKSLPHVGDEVESVDGLQGEVESVNVLRQRVRIIVDKDDEKELHEYDAKDLSILRRRRRGQAKSHYRREDVSGGITSHVKEDTVRPSGMGDVLASQGQNEISKAPGAKISGEPSEGREQPDRTADGMRRRADASDVSRSSRNRRRGQAEGGALRDDTQDFKAGKPRSGDAGTVDAQAGKAEGRRNGRKNLRRDRQPVRQSLAGSNEEDPQTGKPAPRTKDAPKGVPATAKSRQNAGRRNIEGLPSGNQNISAQGDARNTNAARQNAGGRRQDKNSRHNRYRGRKNQGNGNGGTDHQQ